MQRPSGRGADEVDKKREANAGEQRPHRATVGE